MSESQSPSVLAIAPVEPDWNVIRERYLAGDELEDIGEACGVSANAISCKAYREGWKAEALREFCSNDAAVTHEVRLNLVVSVYREARMLGRMSSARRASDADAWSRVRERCIAAAARLLRWEEDPAQRAKLARCLEV